MFNIICKFSKKKNATCTTTRFFFLFIYLSINVYVLRVEIYSCVQCSNVKCSKHCHRWAWALPRTPMVCCCCYQRNTRSEKEMTCCRTQAIVKPDKIMYQLHDQCKKMISKIITQTHKYTVGWWSVLKYIKHLSRVYFSSQINLDAQSFSHHTHISNYKNSFNNHSHCHVPSYKCSS